MPPLRSCCLPCLLITLLITSTNEQCSGVCGTRRCHCDSTTVPGGLAQRHTPQFVVFVYQGPVSQILHRQIHRFLGTNAKNRNGCPLGLTIFASDANTDYNIIKRLSASGIEVEPYSKDPTTWNPEVSHDEWAKDIIALKKRISLQANVSEDSIRGLRAPNLKPGGDAMFRMLDKFRFKYDSSFVFYNGVNASKMWPFTMYEPFDLDVSTCYDVLCPARSWDIWEFPINAWTSADGKRCVYLDECIRAISTNKTEIFNYIWAIFNKAYTSNNRAPIMINLRPESLLSEVHLSALGDFVQRLLERRGVWVMTLRDVLTWVENPKRLPELDTYGGWICERKKVKRPVIEKKNYIMQFLGITDTELVVYEFLLLAFVLFVLVFAEKRDKRHREKEAVLKNEILLHNSLSMQKTK